VPVSAAAPSTDARTPVLLVPGWSDGPLSLLLLARRLRTAGWADDQIARLRFNDRFGSNIEHADEIAAAIERLRRGRETVDVVAHSMGGLALREYLRQQGDDAGVRRAVFLGTPHAGTVAAWLAWGGGAAEMRPGSPFLRTLREIRLPRSVQAITIRSRLDLRVLPPLHGMLHDARDIVLPWTSHRGLLRSRRVSRIVVEFLTAQ